MTGTTITVASKLQYNLRIKHPDKGWDESYIIKGVSEPRRARRKSDIRKDINDYGYSLSFNIPEDVYTTWLDTVKTLPMIKNELVFAYTKKEDVEKRTKDNEARTSGFEPKDGPSKRSGISEMSPA